MKLAASNIAWDKEQDEPAYELLKKYGFKGIEVAPARVVSDEPYEHQSEAAAFAYRLKKEHGLSVVSMQSIWFGCQDNMFANIEERKALLEKTYKAVDFAESMNCPNIVFGCPRQRNMAVSHQENIGREFFKNVGNYAKNHGVIFALEANPPIYETNFLNDTEETLSWVSNLQNYGVALNLDIGTMVENQEKISMLENKLSDISHIHISEPYLNPIKHRQLHFDLAKWLRILKYDGYVSLEMKKPKTFDIWADSVAYVSEVFGY